MTASPGETGQDDYRNFSKLLDLIQKDQERPTGDITYNLVVSALNYLKRLPPNDISFNTKVRRSSYDVSDLFIGDFITVYNLDFDGIKALFVLFNFTERHIIPIALFVASNGEWQIVDEFYPSIGVPFGLENLVSMDVFMGDANPYQYNLPQS